MRAATPVDECLCELLARPRVDEADEAVAAERERLPVRAVRNALDPARHGQRLADLLVRPGVEEEEPVVEVGDRERPPVRAERDPAEAASSGRA